MITREQAAQIATDVLRFKSEAGTYEVLHVVMLDEVKSRHPVPAYGVSESIFDGNWIVYLHDKKFFGLKSSMIIVLARDAGQLLYFGSANDEG
jgi:hypothetical protein